MVKKTPEFKVVGDAESWVCVEVTKEGKFKSYLNSSGDQIFKGTHCYNFIKSKWYSTKDDFEKVFPEVVGNLEPYEGVRRWQNSIKAKAI